MKKYFHEIDISSLKNKTIIIDIDGTLVADSEEEIMKENIEKINELAKYNKLFLCSNNNLHSRNISLSKKLNIEFINSPYKKPNKKVIDSIERIYLSGLVVIGDKYLTDGLFAGRIGAVFIKVRRMESSNENLKIKSFNCVDDFLYLLINFLGKN
ncbi:MAG: hypothetical protein WAV11_01340 [Minisyncoccia bacterium]